jgi:DNA-binding transcriptional LysR family regulator
MRRKIPSTAALVAFEAAARHQSFTLAGDELAVTQSAIGRQIAALEDLVGVKLFRRTRRGVALTSAGLQYSQTVRQRLGEVERDVLEVASRSAGGGSIELGVVPTFATHWLVPRLSSFYEAHPEVQVNLHVRTRPFLFEEAGLHAAIHAGQGGWPGTRADFLMPEPMLVVCAPALIGRKRRLSPADIASLPLIQMTTRPDAWRHWFLAHGAAVAGNVSGPRVELFSMAVQAAVHGLGVALVPEYVAQDELQRGLLSSPVQGVSESGLAYYFIYPQGSESPAPLSLFRSWLLEQA